MKYVFVCGLHRSGTTVIAHEIGKLKDCTGFEDTGALDVDGWLTDEGQYLQDVYPPDPAYGGVGRFGFAPQAHFTEESSLLTPANVSRLRESWEMHWDRNKTIHVEKTPSNLLKTRFLQAAFPNSCFVLIKRHPVPVSLATQKWSRTPIHDLFRHWLRCHEIFDEDKGHLKHVYELRYEDYLREPKKRLEEIANFIGAKFAGSLEVDAADAHNKTYFSRWARMLRSSAFRSYYRGVARRYERSFQEHGYSLALMGAETTFSIDEGTPLGRAMEPALNFGADLCGVLWRATFRLKHRAGVIARGGSRPKTVGTNFKSQVRERREVGQ